MPQVIWLVCRPPNTALLGGHPAGSLAYGEDPEGLDGRAIEHQESAATLQLPACSPLNPGHKPAGHVQVLEGLGDSLASPENIFMLTAAGCMLDAHMQSLIIGVHQRCWCHQLQSNTA